MKLARYWLQVVVVALLFAGNVQAADDKGTVVDSINIDRVVGYLNELGFTGHNVDEDGDLSVMMHGYKVWFRFLNKHHGLQMRFGLIGSEANLRKVNDWNKSKNYTRAYIDDDGDAILESDLDLEGGVTPGAVKEFIRVFNISLGVFLEEVTG